MRSLSASRSLILGSSRRVGSSRRACGPGTRRDAHRGFTLLETMIVVMVIGVLLGIALPNFVRARRAAHMNGCLSNLKEIDAAKQQWAMENSQPGSATPLATDLFGPGKYLTQAPTCPTTGALYDATLGSVDTYPTCPNPTADGGGTYAHVLP